MEVFKSGRHSSWIITAIVAPALLVVLFWMGWRLSDIPQERYLTSAILIAACALGWVLGMVLSPDSKTEAKNFSTVGKGVSLFVSGYLVSKIDGLVTAVFEPHVLLHATEHLAAYRLIGAIASLTLTAILTYIVRVYALTVGE
ncbi:MAG: hypothetical protein ABIK92_10125 [Pseudomonadota bacterium]